MDSNAINLKEKLMVSLSKHCLSQSQDRTAEPKTRDLAEDVPAKPQAIEPSSFATQLEQLLS